MAYSGNLNVLAMCIVSFPACFSLHPCYEGSHVFSPSFMSTHSIRAGATVLDAGEVVGVAEVGILATVGATSLEVFGRPHVGVLSTGRMPWWEALCTVGSLLIGSSWCLVLIDALEGGSVSSLIFMILFVIPHTFYL